MQAQAELPLGLQQQPDDDVLEKVRRLERYDFGSIRSLVMDREGWDEAKTLEVERRTKQFLALGLLDPETHHAPAEDEDVFWHAMITYTPWYFRFCRSVFGGYYHHTPIVGDDPCGPHERSTSAFTRWFGATLLRSARCSSCRVFNGSDD